MPNSSQTEGKSSHLSFFSEGSAHGEWHWRFLSTLCKSNCTNHDGRWYKHSFFLRNDHSQSKGYLINGIYAIYVYYPPTTGQLQSMQFHNTVSQDQDEDGLLFLTLLALPGALCIVPCSIQVLNQDCNCNLGKPSMTARHVKNFNKRWHCPFSASPPPLNR